MFAPTLAMVIPLYFVSALVALCVTRRKSGLTSAIASLNAETVTVCRTFQFPVVNVRVCPDVAGLPTRNWASALTAMVTSAVGWLPSTTVYVAVCPASDTLKTGVACVTITPTLSLSILVSGIVLRPTPLYTSEVLLVGPTTTS